MTFKKTATANPVIHVFNEINAGKYKSVKHFELQKVINGKTLLSNSINISKNRDYALSSPDYWLRIKQGNNWGGYLTGLFKTSRNNIFRGDVNKRQHLLIFEFSDNSNTLTVNYFQNYFTADLSNLSCFHNN